MTLFFIAAAALLLTAVALVVHPLLRDRTDRAEDRQDEVVGLGRERLAELKAQKQSGEISESEYTERVGDLEAQLSDDLQSQGRPADPSGGPGGRWIGVGAAVFIPVLSGLLYLWVGSPQALLPGAAQQASGTGELQPGDVETMVARLSDRLRENPDDAEGWFMLGRSYMVLNRYDDAAEAFGRLREMVGDVPDVLVGEATALAMARDGALRGEPAQLVQRALEQQPDHAQALWIAATAAYQAGDNDAALDYYRRVAPMLEGDQLQQVRGMIEELSPAGAGDSAMDETGDAAASLEVTVTLSPSLRGEAEDGDTVFIFARAVDGPPMPLAAVRKTVADLPVTVTLDDAASMSPQHKLSGFERVTVAARVSRSGEPAARPGDLEGGTGPVSTDTEQVIEVVIDSVVTPEE